MKNFVDFGLNEAYKRVERLGDRRAEIETMIDWVAFRPIVEDMYDNRSERGGRPNIDEVARAIRSRTREAGNRSAIVHEVPRISKEYPSLILRPSGSSASGW